MAHHSCTQPHKPTCIQHHFNPFLAQWYLHRWRFVMMSPSSPSLKVDTGGLSPQPDTPDTPMSPYLPSPDEVTASGDVVEGVINSGSPPWPVVCPAPSFLICLLWQIPPLPTHSECSMAPTHCTLHHSARSKGTNQSPHSWSRLSISTVWTGRLVSDFYLFKENHQTGTPTFTLKDDVNSIITYFLMPFWLTA